MTKAKAALRAAITIAGLFVLSGAAGAAPAAWQGAFGHVPTAYNRTPPTTVTGRDGNPRIQQPGFAPLPAFAAGSSVREIVRLSAASRSLRIRFSNEFSDKPLRMAEVHVAVASEKGEIVPGSDHVLSFAGQRAAIIPAGAPLLSDAIDGAFPALTKLAVTIVYPDETVPPAHTLYVLEAWAAPGNQAGERVMENAVPARSGNHFSEIDIVAPDARHTVVCIGDSITEGVGSTVGAFRGWPDRLAERLQANASTRSWSVVNAGIGSNRLLHDTPSTSALSRFDRDVLAVPGLAKVIIMLGINDIQYSQRNPNEVVTADDMIAALGQLVARSHAKGIDVIGGTITAFEGSSNYTPEGEAARTKVNEWIRHSGVFDGVVDFDRAILDPQRPTQLLPETDTGGHLHPNDNGYARMGDAIDLKLFSR